MWISYTDYFHLFKNRVKQFFESYLFCLDYPSSHQTLDPSSPSSSLDSISIYHTDSPSSLPTCSLGTGPHHHLPSTGHCSERTSHLQPPPRLVRPVFYSLRPCPYKTLLLTQKFHSYHQLHPEERAKSCPETSVNTKNDAG
jgi:hypothetical protein